MADGDVLITPERKKIRREPTALTGLHTCIDAMIAADPQITIATIWERLADEHGAAIAYPTLRTYVTSPRATAKTPGSKVPASREVKGRHVACPSPAAMSLAVNAREADPRHFAHIYDRTCAVAREPQLYGSLIAPKDGEGIVIWPVQDPQQLDARRRGIGLPPLSEDLELYRRGAVMGPFMVPTPP